jgi:DNA polymerase elongation subunit (family B)
MQEQKPVYAIVDKCSRPPVASDTKVQGGLVHKPTPGLYTEEQPAGCLDFAGLYPHVIIAYNMCPTTVGRKGYLESIGFVADRDFVAFPELVITNEGRDLSDVGVTDNTICVLRPSVKVGLCPEVAKSGIALRAVYKKRKNAAIAAKENDAAAFNENLELAVKATNNSLYGILVQKHCVIYNPDMASGITQLSRDLNTRMTHFITTHDFSQYIECPEKKEIYKGMTNRIVYGGATRASCQYPAIEPAAGHSAS